MDEVGSEPHVSGTVGDELRVAREGRGLSLAEIAERTRIPLRHLAAIETSDYQHLPAATYSAGFVRTYAGRLGLDPQDLSRRFRTELAANEPSSTHSQEFYEPADPARVPSRGLVFITLLMAIVLVGGYLYWRGTQLENPAEVATAPSPTATAPALAQAPAPQPHPAAAPATTPPAATPGYAPTDTALITAQEPVWLRVSDADGSKLYEGMLKAGDHFQVPATATDPRLRTGRAEVIKVTVGSITIPQLGPPETLVKDVSLKPDALVARTTGGTNGVPAAPANPATPAPVTNN